MRIIGGNHKGRTIPVPQDFKARPTTDFAKEALFNVLDSEYEFEDLKVLDLFSGTGSISYEFSSRGSGRVWSVEMNPQYSAFIKTTAAKIGFSNITAVHHNAFDFIELCREKFDIVFADPPYSLEGVETLPDRILGAGLVYPERYLILEHGSEHSFREHPCFVKEKVYGRVHFSFFEPK